MRSTICGRTGGRLIGFVFFHLRRLAALALRLVNQSDTAATAQQEVEGAKRRKEKKLRQAPKIRLAWASRARPTFQTDRDSSLAFCLPLRQSHSPRNTLWSILNELASAASCFASSVSLCPPSTGQQVEAFEIWRQTIRFEFHLTRNFECSNNKCRYQRPVGCKYFGGRMGHPRHHLGQVTSFEDWICFLKKCCWIGMYSITTDR